MLAFFSRSRATKRSLADASGSSRMARSCRRWPGRSRWAMSRIASRVSSVSASGSTLRKRPAGGLERGHAVGRQQAVRRVVRPEGEQLLVFELRHAVTVSLGLGPAVAWRPCPPAAAPPPDPDDHEGEVRIEHDSMGEVRVPVAARWGAQTQRAVENFPISGERMPPELIHALGSIKGVAATVNGRLRVIPKDVAAAIHDAASEMSFGALRRPLPARRLPDRLRHEHQHERQRGAGPPGLRAPRPAGAPQRRRQRLPVVERRVPVGASAWPPAG